MTKAVFAVVLLFSSFAQASVLRQALRTKQLIDIRTVSHTDSDGVVVPAGEGLSKESCDALRETRGFKFSELIEMDQTLSAQERAFYLETLGREVSARRVQYCFAN